MRLSAPIFRLKRKAKLLSREAGIPLHRALDRIASQEGYQAWSHLAARHAQASPAAALFPRLTPGDLVLVAARPGHGKTLMSLALAAEAVKAGHRAVVFTLEDTVGEVLGRLKAIDIDYGAISDRFDIDCSDAISADYIIAELAFAASGTLVVVDYLQLLDQRRENPDLDVQVRRLKVFARDRGLIVICLSQIHRSYDPAVKPLPDFADVRLPNKLDLGLFDKACFLNDGEVSIKAAA